MYFENTICCTISECLKEKSSFIDIAYKRYLISISQETSSQNSARSKNMQYKKVKQ